MDIVGYLRKISRGFTHRKHHLDLVIALITVPVLLTVLFTNLLNLQNKKNADTKQDNKPIIIRENSSNVNTTPVVRTEKIIQTDSPSCKKEVGPINITFPEEEETVTDNPVCITIKYDNENYCSVVWSYRINGGNWSEYGSNSVCLYNMPKGNIKFDLRVQSTTSNDQTNLTRNFSYEGISTPSATESAK
jgi:hypothetical protein